MSRLGDLYKAMETLRKEGLSLNVLRTTMLSSKTDIPVKSVERYVKRLKDAGLIKYSGSSKSGGYFLSDSAVRE